MNIHKPFVSLLFRSGKRSHLLPRLLSLKYLGLEQHLSYWYGIADRTLHATFRLDTRSCVKKMEQSIVERTEKSKYGAWLQAEKASENLTAARIARSFM